MLSERYKFIFLHVEKTGGNSISKVLLPICDDKLSCEAHHDGINRFAIRGPSGRIKHAPLSAYAKELGDSFADYKLLMSVRHPFSRALSFYFSPHRWYRGTSDGSWQLHDAVWNEDVFFDVLGSGHLPPAVSFLDIVPRPRPDVLIRMESFRADLSRAIDLLGLPAESLPPLPHVNRTAAKDGLKDRLLKSVTLRDQVETLFADDMRTFGYDSYRHNV